MRSTLWMRQLALVSYGNTYLKNPDNLEKWYRHQIFQDSLPTFRCGITKQLLSHSFSYWLSYLQQHGVQQLSLHAFYDFFKTPVEIENLFIRTDEFVIVAHHPQQPNVWIIAEEKAVFDDDLNRSWIPDSSLFADFDNDYYWQLDIKTEQIPVLHPLSTASWQQIYQNYKTMLFDRSYGQKVSLDITSIECYGARYREHAYDFESFPLLAGSNHSAYPSKLLNAMIQLKGYMHSDLNCKNEASEWNEKLYEREPEFRHWMNLFELNFKNLICMASNNAGQTKFDDYPDAYIITDPRLIQANTHTDEQEADSLDPLSAPMDAKKEQHPLVTLLIAILALLLVALLIYAIAKMIVAWGFIAVLIGVVALFAYALLSKDK